MDLYKVGIIDIVFFCVWEYINRINRELYLFVLVLYFLCESFDLLFRDLVSFCSSGV